MNNYPPTTAAKALGYAAVILGVLVFFYAIAHGLGHDPLPPVHHQQTVPMHPAPGRMPK